MSANDEASVCDTPKRVIIDITTKCQGPAPLGVGMMMARLMAAKMTMAFTIPNSAEKGKQKKAR